MFQTPRMKDRDGYFRFLQRESTGRKQKTKLAEPFGPAPRLTDTNIFLKKLGGNKRLPEGCLFSPNALFGTAEAGLESEANAVDNP
jgi:hypothetical protein